MHKYAQYFKSFPKAFISVLMLELIRQMLKYGKLLSLPTLAMWIAQFGAIVLGGIICWKRKQLKWSFFLIYIWIIWALICFIRGIFAIDIYWDAKNLLGNSPALFLPILGILFASPLMTLSFLKHWNILFIVQILLIIAGIIGSGRTHFIMGPAYLLYASLFVILPERKWKIFIILLLIVMLSDLGDRSQVIKAAIAIIIAIAVSIGKSILMKFLTRVFSMLLYPLALTLLYLGITGQYNIFDSGDKSIDNVIIYVDGQTIEEEKNSLSVDSRTFLYIDLLTSAITNDYLLFGRTPSRGYDAPLFFSHMGTNDLEPGMRLERNKSEFCHPNILTWMGLVGVIIYALIFIHATILGLFFSHNIYTIYIAGFVSFNWFYGWIENILNFDMINIGQWILIGICLSPTFRSMDNSQFRLWFTSIFDRNESTKYHKLQLLKLYLRVKKHKILKK